MFPLTSILTLWFAPSVTTSKSDISPLISSVYSYISGENSGVNVYPVTSNFNKSELEGLDVPSSTVVSSSSEFSSESSASSRVTFIVYVFLFHLLL